MTPLHFIAFAVLLCCLLWLAFKNVPSHFSIGRRSVKLQDWLLIGFICCTSVYAGAFVNRLLDSYKESDGGMIPVILGTVFMQICLLVGAFVFKKFATVKFRLFKSASMRDIWEAVKHYIYLIPILITASLFWGNLIEYVTGKAPEPQDIVAALSDIKSDWLLIVAFVSFGILAPIVEEIYFRGFLYGMIKPYFSKLFLRLNLAVPSEIEGKLVCIFAAGISALVFASVHISFSVFLPLFCIGMVFTALYEKRGNLLAPILIHCFFNTLNAILILSGVVNINEGF